MAGFRYAVGASGDEPVPQPWLISLGGLRQGMY